MIFGKEYDLSLWYMLKVKNLYLGKTINFIKELPEELLNNIQTTYIKGTNNNRGLDDKQDPFYNIQSEVNPNIYYKFYIMCRDLYIFKMQTTNGVDRVIFSITLSPNNSNDIINLEKNKKRTLGSICIGQYPEKNCKEVDYSLKKTGLGYVLSHNYVMLGNMIEIKFARPSSIKYMPEEMWRDKPYQKKLIKQPLKNI